MDGEACRAAVLGVAKCRTRLSDFTFTLHFHALEKEMATHSSVLAWRIPGTGEPGGLLCMGSHRVGHDWSDLAAAASNCQTVFQIAVPYYTSSVRVTWAPIFGTAVLFNFSDSNGYAVLSCVLICTFLMTNDSVHFSGALLYLLATPKIFCKVSVHIWCTF